VGVDCQSAIIHVIGYIDYAALRVECDYVDTDLILTAGRPIGHWDVGNELQGVARGLPKSRRAEGN
jgi:hypothetical protein